MVGWHHRLSRKLQEIVKDREAWSAAAHGGSQRVGHDLATKQQHPCLIPTVVMRGPVAAL